MCCVIVFAGLPSPLSIPAGVIRLLLWLTKCLISALLWLLLSATSGNHKAIRKIFLLEILGKFYLYFNLRANTGNVYIFKSLFSFTRKWQEQRRRWIILVVINLPNWQKLLDSPKIDGILILNLILLYWLFMR